MIYDSFSVPSINWMTIIVVTTVLGCGGTSPMTEGFESLSDEEQLPNNWELRIEEGTYKTAASREAREGSVGLAFGGAGGFARFSGPPITVVPGCVLMSSAWVKPKQCNAASVVVGLEQLDGQSIVGQKFPTSISVATDAEDWIQRSCILISPGSDKPSKVRFFASLTGEGLLLLDEVQYSIHQIDTTRESLDTSFEVPESGGRYSGWNVSCDGNGAATESIQRPQDGARCLKVYANGKWSVATHEFPLKRERRNVLVHCFARSVKGSARIKIEYFLGDKHQGDSFSEATTQGEWQPIFAVGDWEKVSTCDFLRISLTVENPKGADGCSADFDDFSMLVIRP